MNTQEKPDKEIRSISAVYSALQGLDAQAQARVIEYVLKKLSLKIGAADEGRLDEGRSYEAPPPAHPEAAKVANESQKDSPGAEFSGISPIAQRWIQRSGLPVDQLSSIFSLVGDEIDLIANSVPGGSGRARVRSVVLLKGVAAYLGSGAARVTHDKVKEACVHYDAYDATNFAKYLKALAPEVSGGKELGYTLTARGLANAAAVVKGMLTPDSTE
jgi:hypothetical protein